MNKVKLVQVSCCSYSGPNIFSITNFCYFVTMLLYDSRGFSNLRVYVPCFIIKCLVIFQRLLPMLEGGSDLFTQGAPRVPTSSVYTIRPFTAADKVGYYVLVFLNK